ncbi:TPA: transcriptional regulator [Pseudomonas aeruginosa]|uniref:CII family transcriptional regulator n=1 Tax=Pseudomonas aeruginosa TaxID=287 RepID=UPI000EB5803F|nr:CII family transcriptional regulator [Pseudomonas aeruginosa]EKX3033482.1 transcriptional regulator [Pseudomonas aeruginosa]EKX3045800.1 transcriptional regulator [Pseudomonas aeruginosa]EKX3063936.1 transcriptional regulator [Pseudomonas aeruginosa]EKX3101628.1 transcriptional regulator [Pseudomonas aeruginosa]HBP4696660.1 transcriptional regulator [Pseudomonas aeruginosa]
MTASQLNAERDARAREFESLVLNRLLSVGQRTVADAIGVSESTVSRWKEGEIERWCKVLAHLVLQLVPEQAVVVNADYLRSLETLAELGLRAEKKRPGPLGWD